MTLLYNIYNQSNKHKLLPALLQKWILLPLLELSIFLII